MHSNHLYNLMHQLIIEQKSLWRMKEYYKEDSDNCDSCQNFWKKMIDDKESHIKEITGMLKEHMA